MSPSDHNQSDGWLVGAFRLTFFVDAPVEDGKPLFEAITGTKIKTTVVDHDVNPPVESIQGQVDGIDVQMNHPVGRKGRLDFHFGNPLGRVLRRRDVLLDLIRNCIHNASRSISNVVRLAYGAEYLFRVETPAEGYDELNALLRTVEVDFQKGTDFFYRINRGRERDVGGHRIHVNRLTSWSCIASRGLRLTSDGQQLNEGLNQYVRLEVDFNTSPKINLRDLPLTTDQIEGLLISLEEDSFNFTKGDNDE